MSSSENPDPTVEALTQSADPHGRAALLLVESLMHVLREKTIVTAADLVDVVDTALAVQDDAADDSGPNARQARVLLTEIAASLAR